MIILCYNFRKKIHPFTNITEVDVFNIINIIMAQISLNWYCV